MQRSGTNTVKVGELLCIPQIAQVVEVLEDQCCTMKPAAHAYMEISQLHKCTAFRAAMHVVGWMMPSAGRS